MADLYEQDPEAYINSWADDVHALDSYKDFHVIEEYLTPPSEYSVSYVTLEDGTSLTPLSPSQEFKQYHDYRTGGL